MNASAKRLTILLADDDPDDRDLLCDAMAETVDADVRTVRDGEEMLAYLRRHGGYGTPAKAPRPALILLDLSMPRLSGHEVLTAIKADDALRRIPVVVLTTSRSSADVARSYDLGASSYVSKPSSYRDLVDAMRTVGRYWCETVVLPS